MPKSPNLTIIFIALSAVVVAGIIGGIYLTAHDKDATAFYGFFTATLATVIAFGGIARGQNSINESVDQVKQNVNGRLSRLIELATQNATSRADLTEVRKIQADSGVVPTVTDNTNV